MNDELLVCPHCGEREVESKGPAQGICGNCEPLEVDRAHRGAAEEVYQDRIYEAEQERMGHR